MKVSEERHASVAFLWKRLLNTLNERLVCMLCGLQQICLRRESTPVLVRQTVAWTTKQLTINTSVRTSQKTHLNRYNSSRLRCPAKYWLPMQNTSQHTQIQRVQVQCGWKICVVQTLKCKALYPNNSSSTYVVGIGNKEQMLVNIP